MAKYQEKNFDYFKIIQIFLYNFNFNFFNVK